ncbi:hypothetical protein Zmor_012711 [Zophobas morio]|uniref:Uncharacterized protein n=1 Tax=Zophobas morio TaxID=2755281 RepID=A0AA38IE20_9CUCU|nr:hypothetical protein Zmor_012711 [Zophobas morio]
MKVYSNFTTAGKKFNAYWSSFEVKIGHKDNIHKETTERKKPVHNTGRNRYNTLQVAYVHDNDRHNTPRQKVNQVQRTSTRLPLFVPKVLKQGKAIVHNPFRLEKRKMSRHRTRAGFYS